MRRTLKYLGAAGLAGMLAIGLSVPSQAWQSRRHAAVGAAAATAANAYYGGYASTYGYGYAPDYSYDYSPGPYAYEPSYGPSMGYTEPGYGAYAYAPADPYTPGYDAYAAVPYPGPYVGDDCATQGSYGKGADLYACGG